MQMQMSFSSNFTKLLLIHLIMQQDHHLIVKMLNLVEFFFIQQPLSLHSFVLKAMQILNVFQVLLYLKIRLHHLIQQLLIIIQVKPLINFKIIVTLNFKIIVILRLMYLTQIKMQQKYQQYFLRLMQFKIQVQMNQLLEFNHH